MLLHGFSGSPLEMIPLAETLAARGWTISIARLAGHGTSPVDLARSTWQEWMDSARDAYRELARRCPRPAVVGLSMGGALGLTLAGTEPDPPRAVVTISTPIHVRPALAAASRAVGRVLPVAPVPFRLGPRERAMWRYRSPYRAVPLAATHEVEQLLAATRALLPSLRIPLLIVQGRRDWIIPRDSADGIAGLARSADSMVVWLPRSGHVATLDRDRDLLYDKITAFLDRYF